MSPPASKLLSVVAIIIYGVALSDAAAASCFPKFKNVEMIQSVGSACAKTLMAQGVNLTTIPTPADLEKKNWDDKCMANCTMTELKLISNNTFKKDALLALLKENVPQEVLPKLTSLVDECEAIAFQKNDHSKNNTKEHSKDGQNEKAVAKGKSAAGRSGNAKAGKNNRVTTAPTKANKVNEQKLTHHDNRICKETAKFVHCFQEKGQQAC